MFKIALISMPFAALDLPSIGLTQLRSVLARNLQEPFRCDIHYLNHDFALYFGKAVYDRISTSVHATISGLGDWIFRPLAFPQAEENATAYLHRYGHLLVPEHPWLQQAGEARSRLDLFLDQLILGHALDEYDVVGLTSMFAQNVASFAMARKLKARNSKLVTLMGGANCETRMGGVMARRVEALDFVFSGSALKSFPRLIEHLMRGETEKCHQIRGVFSRQKLSRMSCKELEETGEELDIEEEVALEYDDFLGSLEEKCPEATPALLFETSRGCWWGQRSHCTFCGLNGTTMAYRAKSPPRALQDFEKLFRYAPRVTHFKAVDNILPRPYLTTVLPRLRPPENARLFYEIKADLKELEVKALADARIVDIQPGIEALNTSTLKLMRKGTTSFQNLMFLKNCLSYGVTPIWNLLVGFPGELEAVYRKYVADLPSLFHLPPPTGVYPVRFDRFSPYYTAAKEYGLKLEPLDFYGLVYPFPPEELGDLAYFFADHNHENAYHATTGKWIRNLEELVLEWNARWHRHDASAKPELTVEWEADRRIIRDSRSGVALRRELDESVLRLLDQLRRPATRGKLLEELSEADLDQQLNELRGHRLVFEENDSYFSLIASGQREQGCL